MLVDFIITVVVVLGLFGLACVFLWSVFFSKSKSAEKSIPEKRKEKKQLNTDKPMATLQKTLSLVTRKFGPLLDADQVAILETPTIFRIDNKLSVEDVLKSPKDVSSGESKEKERSDNSSSKKRFPKSKSYFATEEAE